MYKWNDKIADNFHFLQDLSNGHLSFKSENSKLNVNFSINLTIAELKKPVVSLLHAQEAGGWQGSCSLALCWPHHLLILSPKAANQLSNAVKLKRIPKFKYISQWLPTAHSNAPIRMKEFGTIINRLSKIEFIARTKWRCRRRPFQKGKVDALLWTVKIVPHSYSHRYTVLKTLKRNIVLKLIM